MIRLRQTVPLAAVFLIFLHDASAGPPASGPAFIVEAAYPGAGAAIVDDTVAAPIELQLNGIEKLQHLWSRCKSDGTYTLEMIFAPGSDPKAVQSLVQNRVSLALPVLPEAVKQIGVTTKKKPGGLLMTVCLFSPNGRYDNVYLGSYAATQIRDELTRIPDVADVVVLGRPDYTLHILLDSDRLAARNLAGIDVLQALADQKLGTGTIGVPPVGALLSLTIPAGPLADRNKIEDIIIKTSNDGRTIRMKDVARAEVGVDRSHQATLDGKPTVALAIYPTSDSRVQQVSEAVRSKMEELRRRFVQGVDADTMLDFTQNAGRKAPEVVVLDLNLPGGSPPERTAAMLDRGSLLLRQLPGVRHVLALSEQPFDRDRDPACLAVSLDPAHTEPADRHHLVEALRSKFAAADRDVRVRVRDVTGGFPRFGYSLDFAIRGPERARLQELAEQLVTLLSQDRRLTEVWADPRPVPGLAWIDVDREKLAMLGVGLKDISNTLEVYLGSATVARSNTFDRTWQLPVNTDGPNRTDLGDLTQLQVRNDKGQMIRLSAVVTIRKSSELACHERLDLYPAISITANPSPGISIADARSICERLAATAFRDEHSSEYRLVWLSETSSGRAPAPAERTAAPAAVKP